MPILLFSGAAHAEYDPVAWLGGDLGLSVPNENNTTSRSIWGVDAGAKLGTEWGIGAYYSTSHKDESANGTTTPFNYDLYGITGGYYFEGSARGVYLGAMLGMSKVGSQLGGTNFTTSPMHWGLMAGYDYMITDHFSLGGQIDYVSISSSNTNVTVSGQSVTANTDQFSLLNFMLSARIWF